MSKEKSAALSMAINSEAELLKYPHGTFVDLIAFNQHSISAVAIEGTSPVWEMHPDTDELFLVTHGQLNVQILYGHELKVVSASAGNILVVPKGLWHKTSAEPATQFMYYTPGSTLHSSDELPY